MKKFILANIIIFNLLLNIGCSEQDLSSATLEFYPEYDYIDGYDIFPGQNHKYVSNAFDDGNTIFSPHYSDEIVVEPGIATVEDIYNFVDINADCFLDDDLQCVRINSTLKKLRHLLYLTSMKSFPTSRILGVTLGDGVKYQAICFIFVDNINNFANRADVNMSPSSLTEGVVIHELGHGRADLEHLCFDGTEFMMDDTNHAQIFCVMTNSFPKPKCADEDDNPTLKFGPQFCDSCIVNLKNVNW